MPPNHSPPKGCEIVVRSIVGCIKFPITPETWTITRALTCNICGQPGFTHDLLNGYVGCATCQYIAIPENVNLRFIAQHVVGGHDHGS